MSWFSCRTKTGKQSKRGFKSQGECRTNWTIVFQTRYAKLDTFYLFSLFVFLQSCYIFCKMIGILEDYLAYCYEHLIRINHTKPGNIVEKQITISIMNVFLIHSWIKLINLFMIDVLLYIWIECEIFRAFLRIIWYFFRVIMPISAHLCLRSSNSSIILWMRKKCHSCLCCFDHICKYSSFLDP